MGIIYSSSPIFIILISCFFFKEKLTFLRSLGVLICFSGVLLIIIKAELSFLISLKFTSGDIWMIGASIGLALYTIYLFNWKSTLPLLERFTLISMFGFISLLPFFLIENFFYFKTTFSTEFLFWVLFAALSPSIIAFLLFNHVNKILGVSILGSVFFFYTVYGALYGYFFFNENLYFYHLVGSLMVFLGIYLIKKKHETKT